MKRKVNKVGKNTLTVSLPSKWANKYNVEKGHEIDVIEEGTTLHLCLEDFELNKGSIVIDIPTEKHYMRRLMNAPYIKGFDEIRMNFNDRKIFDRIQRDAKILLGFEIMEHDDNHCILRNVSKGLESQFETMLNRLFHIVMSFNKEILIRLKDNDFKDLKSLDEYERTANRINLFCKRMVNKNLVSNKTINNTAIYTVQTSIERVADELKGILDFLIKSNNKKIKMSKNTKELFNLVQESLSVSYDKFKSFLKGKNYLTIGDAFEKQRTIRYYVLNNKSKYLETDTINSVICSHLIAAIEHMQHMSEELLL